MQQPYGDDNEAGWSPSLALLIAYRASTSRDTARPGDDPALLRTRMHKSFLSRCAITTAYEGHFRGHFCVVPVLPAPWKGPTATFDARQVPHQTRTEQRLLNVS